jgi:poly-gamma-glutamate capsule biosynthesis protein CapA/YwtB (metallophosphatase superfamily)
VVEVKGVKVAVLGFSSYAWSQSIVDIEAGAALVRKAKGRAELVVVQMHAGGEGADKTHVRPGTEMFLGENRGDPIKFARAVVDAGADLVVGHGPHVMRGMEFYKGKLIAYSLGNFAGYKALTTTGVVGVGGVLKVTLRKDGSYVTGSLVPTRMVAPGLPRMDAGKEALALVRGLSESDLPATAARIGDDGSIAPR